jgi:ferric-dicitrate binding protein FerR (iron transport regulator)
MNRNAERLLNVWLEGDLSTEDEEALRDLLAEDPAAREACYDLMLLDQMLGEREEARGAHAADAVLPFPRKKSRVPRTAIAAVTAAAALIVAGLWMGSRPDDIDARRAHGPRITASSDSRITIAQREDRSQWMPGELMRLERGTAAIQLREGVLAHFQGPAAIELANDAGDIRLIEGQGTFQVEPGGSRFEIAVPGGIVQTLDGQFACQILPDQTALVEVDSGDVLLGAHAGRKPAKVTAGEAVRLEGDGTIAPAARPGIPFRVGLPEELALFSDDFKAADGTLLAEHAPAAGQRWEILEELNPTVIRKQRLDTSAGTRRLLARLAPHDSGGAGSVYVFTFSLLPPAWSHDKVQRMDGIESIAIIDDEGHELFCLMAEAMNVHRWQLKGGGQTSPLTPVCALWDHQLTLCYGLDGRVTLHDGATAQAPVIAKLWLRDPAPAGGFLISNRTGGDLAFRKISTSLLRVPSARTE